MNKSSVHSFNTGDAKEYGIGSAVLLYNIRYWLRKNRANEQHIHDGRVWTYNSRKAFAELFPYLSESQIYRRLSKLEDAGVLIKDNFNDHAYDRTSWYSLNEKEFIIARSDSNHCTKSHNPENETAQPIPDNNPNVTTDNNPNSNSVGRQKPTPDPLPDIAEYGKEAHELAQLLLDSICTWDKTHQYQNKAKPPKNWIVEIERAMRLDNRTYEQLEFVIKYLFTQSDDIAQFWAKNIQSGGKLRSKFDQIKHQLQNRKKNHDKAKPVSAETINRNATKNLDRLYADAE